MSEARSNKEMKDDIIQAFKEKDLRIKELTKELECFKLLKSDIEKMGEGGYNLMSRMLDYRDKYEALTQERDGLQAKINEATRIALEIEKEVDKLLKEGKELSARLSLMQEFISDIYLECRCGKQYPLVKCKFCKREYLLSSVAVEQKWLDLSVPVQMTEEETRTGKVETNVDKKIAEGMKKWPQWKKGIHLCGSRKSDGTCNCKPAGAVEQKEKL